MPHLAIADHGVEAVARFGDLLNELIARAETVKKTASVDPPLDRSDFQDLLRQAKDVFPPQDPSQSKALSDFKKSRRYAITETAVREAFTSIMAVTDISTPDAARIWNLFDIATLLAEKELCDPCLMYWLVEDLLDCLTIAGCRLVFEFLESRGKRMTTQLPRAAMNIILRTCNELLRRISKAEDAAFCGRIYIYTFQIFPLGDKSSVNSRGEYHIENVTTYDDTPSAKMEVDTPPAESKPTPESQGSAKTAAANGKKDEPQANPLDPDVLYPIFWSLQESFSQPKKLFDPQHLAKFKFGLEATLTTFQAIKVDPRTRPDRQFDDAKRGAKRKRESDEAANGVNLKYLTSRDLFELEISDLSFRRYVLVQALIILDFLLSLTQKAKDKMTNIQKPNGAVIYPEVLAEEDAKWALDFKEKIKNYLKLAMDGAFFFRMVESVLSRDKNWVRWKCENCPSIEMPAVSAATFAEAKGTASKMATNKRLRPTPMGSLSLEFLADNETSDELHKFKARKRYAVPDLETYRKKIMEDDLEIEMPTNNQTKAAAIESKASKSWRALRIAGKSRLAVFDKIDNPDKIDAIFKDDPDPEVEEPKGTQEQAEGDVPEDRSLVVVIDPCSSVAKRLHQSHPTVFVPAISHTSRKHRDGEKNGVDYHFVDLEKFRMMRDGDQFIQLSEGEGDLNFGLSRKTVDAVIDSGKVPVFVTDLDGAQMIKDMGYSARFVHAKAPPADELEKQLREQNVPEEELQETLKKAAADAQPTPAPDFYNSVLPSDSPDAAYKALEDFVYGRVPEAAQEEAVNGDEGADAEKEVDETPHAGADAAANGEADGEAHAKREEAPAQESGDVTMAE